MKVTVKQFRHMTLLQRVQYFNTVPQRQLSFTLQGIVDHGYWHFADDKQAFKRIRKQEKQFKSRFKLTKNQFNALLAGDPMIPVATYRTYIIWCKKHFK